MAKLLFSETLLETLGNPRGTISLHEQLPEGGGGAKSVGKQFGTLRAHFDQDGERWLELDLPDWPFELSNFMLVYVESSNEELENDLPSL